MKKSLVLGLAALCLSLIFLYPAQPGLAWPIRTATRTSLATRTPTRTPTKVASATATATRTPTRTPTQAATATKTATFTPTSTQAATATATRTPSATPSRTPTATATLPPTATPTKTATHTPTWTPTWTPTRTPTWTPTWTPAPTATRTPTWTPTWTPAPTATHTPTSAPTATVSGNPHASIAVYNGPQTCIACHPTQAEDALHSEHMQWEGKWPQVNTYCTAPEPADYACLSCHASTGKVKNLTVNDVDCLVCHNDTYQRSLGPLSIPLTVTDWQGNVKTYNTPQKNANGDYEFQPRFDLMPPGTTMESLAQNVHLPTRATCLRCHAKAGGGDGTKRGDLSTASINPSLNSDVHMSPSGGNLLCQDCHTVSNHKIAGKGIDLRISEGPTPACTDCHSSRPHGNSKLDTHAGRVACQTCHIPRYAKDVSTELSRDWTNPVWNPTGCNGQGAWIGEEIRGSNLIPTYTFWNGNSAVYDLSQPIQPGPDGVYTLAEALGTIVDSKLYPVKVHTAYQPRHDASGRMVAYDVLWNFMTGFFEQAAQRGVAFMGLSGSYTWVETRAEQLITHGVEPADNALECATCHQSRAQMDLPALGYVIKGSSSTVCAQCHSPKTSKGFYENHTKHVDDKRYDCSWCHTFSRPERGLKMP